MKNNLCDIKNNENDFKNNLSVCSQLSFVDESKTDMEYNCLKCENI